MFTGIISHQGVVRRATPTEGGMRLRITSTLALQDLSIGASVAHNGCCLTVTSSGEEDGERWHDVELSSHTLAHTTLGNWREGHRMHLEAALRVGDALGGHLLSGHVDGIATIESREDEGECAHFTVWAPDALAPYIATKGSVALDGISLTVTWVSETLPCRFGLTLIPHTLQVSECGAWRAGDALNLEVDLLARYCARILQTGKHT